MATRTARTAFTGTLQEGSGRTELVSSGLGTFDVSWPKRTSDRADGTTSPEELIAAAHAGCFTMALAFQLQGAGFTPTELATEAVVTIEQEGGGFTIRKSALSLNADVPGIDRGKFEELARAAEKNCPVSKVLNAEITMDFTLAQAAAA